MQIEKSSLLRRRYRFDETPISFKSSFFRFFFSRVRKNGSSLRTVAVFLRHEEVQISYSLFKSNGV